MFFIYLLTKNGKTILCSPVLKTVVDSYKNAHRWQKHLNLPVEFINQIITKS